MGRHVDDRGVIQDLLGSVDSVTWISTKKDAIRGNHIHLDTEQWTYVISGRLLSVLGNGRELVAVGEGELGARMVHEPKGVSHAWRALEDTTCLVFTKGPRAGDNYETDTIRLKEPLLS